MFSIKNRFTAINLKKNISNDILGVIYPYTKVTGCLFVCVFVPKDLANRCTDRVLLIRVDLSFVDLSKNFFSFSDNSAS